MVVKTKQDQITVGVAVEALWKAMALDAVIVIPKIMSNIVRSIDVIEGDGGLDSVESNRVQTEKIVELDESQYRYALQVVKGPALTLRNFSALTSFFQLRKMGEQETLVDMKVEYETEKEEANSGEIAMQPITVGVAVEALWKAMALDAVTVIPKIMSSVRSIDVIEGDGGLDRVGSDGAQTEKIVELDESHYRYALQVIKGPALTLRNFSALTTFFQLKKIGEQETLVDMKVVYETEKEEVNSSEIAMQPVTSYVQLLEKYLLES
ncbi:hypothetical protein DVH24_004343 [Malus domestica]|uniref:Bet v I/Major latex protein domain-containing protein n=1 Tax=Malus domestica TaxID=3750 RepID=A0A498K847_MALDO|nr:hypothetical protein DVH24_004343 [Malus domestica]